MFRVLSEDESRNVIRWQAPDLTGTVPVANTRQVATPVRLGNSLSASRLLHEVAVERAGGRPVSAPGGHASELADGSTSDGTATRQTTSIPMSNPSATMLQTSYDEGYARGYAEGNAALHQESVKQLQELTMALGKPALKVPDLVLEQELIGLALDVARLLVQREVEVDPTALASLVRAGMEQLPNASQSQASVYLHPLDATVLRELTIQPEGVEYLDDVNLKRGDCRIVSGASTVRSGVNDWLEVMGAELGLLPMSITRD